MSIKLKWHTEKRKVKDLIPFEGNPRQMTEKQVQDLQKSLEKFNLVEIPAINTDNKIIAGHQRLAILKLLKREKEIVDVRVPNRKLTEKEFEEYLLRSNKNTGEWDWDLLANFDKDFLEDVGFDEVKINKFLGLEDNKKDEKMKEIFEIIVECKNEQQQKENYEKLIKGGYQCRLLTL